MMPLGEYGSPFDGLTDEEKQALLAQYAPEGPSLGPVTRAGGGAMPGPMRPPPSAMPSMESGPAMPRTPGGVDPDLMRRFAEAQQRGAGNASFASLGNRLRNAGRLYAGLPEVADDSTSLRGRPVADLMQQEGVKQQQRNAARQSELDGVNLDKTRAETTRAEAQAKSTAEEAAREAALGSLDSPETQAERRATAALLAKNPNVTPELLNSLNGLQLRNLALRGGQQINAEAMAGLRQSQLDMTGEQQAFQRQMDKWRLGLETERLAQQWDISQLTLEQAKELAELRNRFDKEKEGRERDAATGNKVAADTKDISEAFDKAGGPNFYAKYDEVSELLAKYKEDIPGFGKVDGLKPDMFVSEEALTMRQGIGQMLAEYRKGITGAGMSNAEREEYGQITGLLKTNNERSVRQGVERLRGGMDARFRAMAGGYRPEAVETYASRVPMFGRALRGSPVQPPTTPRPARAPMPAGDLGPAPAAPPAAGAIREVSVRGQRPGYLKQILKDGETVRIKETGKMYRMNGTKLIPVKG